MAVTRIFHPGASRRHRPGLITRLARMAALRRQRSRLSQLDQRALDDIGVTRDTADAEAARPAWDAPETWRL